MAEDTNMGMRQKVSLGLIILGSVLLTAAYSTYFGQVLAGRSTPNPVTWVTAFIVCILNTVSYFQLIRSRQTDENAARAERWRKSAMSIIMTVLTGLVALYALITQSFTSPTRYDALCGIACLVVGAVWLRSGRWSKTASRWQWWQYWEMNEAALINLCVQAIFLISFLPTIIGVANGAARELWLAWLIAAVAYGVNIAGLLAGDGHGPNGNWRQGDYLELAYPIINGVIGNGVVAFVVLIVAVA